MNGLHHHAPKGGGLLLRVEEDRTWDAEMLHGTEVVDCVAIEGDGVLTAEAAESETKYYYLDSLRVAMREGDVVFLIVSDHLGTTSLVLDEDEVYHSETRHYAYGTERWADGTVPTDYRFTGQRMQAQTNLYHMGARWYDDRLGTWVSADVIVPEPGSSRALNRFAFVYWNPLTLVDLSGFGPRVPMIEGVCSPATCVADPDLLEWADYRDVTMWLVSEMSTNVDDPAVQQIRHLTTPTAGLLGTYNRSALGSGSLIAAAFVWRSLVKDSARWDFKHRINEKLDDAVKIGGEWFEYSVPGNVHYGYVGRAAGFSAEDLHLGAGWAEMTDPAHAGDPHRSLGFLYRNPAYAETYYDDPRDYAAIELGSALYDAYGSDLTVGRFLTSLPTYYDVLHRMPIPRTGGARLYQPHSLGFFDGGR